MSKYEFGSEISVRAVLAEGICEAADMDDRVWAVTSDCGQDLKRFVRDHEDRFVDVGIAEQNAAGIAAGLALSGAVPFIMGMAPFVTMRAFEQNRSAISYQNLPVKIVGYAAGMTTGGGSTHYAMEDIAIMKSIANMSVISVSDPALGTEAIKASLKFDHPCYFRAGNGQYLVLYNPEEIRFEFGKGIVARDGKDLTIFTHGAMVADAVMLADKLRKDGISIKVIDMFTIKPIDKELVIAATKETKKVVVWEDHYIYGGLGSTIADLYADEGAYPDKFLRIGIPETYPGFGTREALYKRYGMDAESVGAKINDMLK